MTGDVWSDDGRFRFQARNPHERNPRWWRCYIGNSDTVASSGTLAELTLLADAGMFDNLITTSTSLIHGNPREGF